MRSSLPLPGPGVVDDRDPVAVGAELERLGQPRAHFGGLDVALHRADRRAERLEPVEHLGAREVARVDDQIGGAHCLDAGVRNLPRASRHVGVRDDRDAHEALGVLGDLAGLEAAGADVDALRAPVLVDADLLEVRVEAAPRSDHRVASRVPERGALSAGVTDLGHETRKGSRVASLAGSDPANNCAQPRTLRRLSAERITAYAAWRPWSRLSPPARASACSRVSQVMTPNAHGTPEASWTSMIPRAASVQT